MLPLAVENLLDFPYLLFRNMSTITNTSTYVEHIVKESQHDDALISKIARGEVNIGGKPVQQIAQSILIQTGQLYGLLFASGVAAVEGSQTDKTTGIISVQGGVIWDAEYVGDFARETAEEFLTYPVEFNKAYGINGVAKAAMALPYMP